MRKVIVSMNVTLDGFAAGPHGELDWATMDAEIAKEVKANSTANVLLMGRVTYDMMVQYWPTAPTDDLFTDMMNHSPKFVFSRTLEAAFWGDWDNTTVVHDNIAETIATLKAQPGKDMVILGGPDIIATFAALDLIDEYHLNVNPVVIGEGRPLFKDVTTPLRLTLLETKPFPSGVVALRYAVVRA